MDKLLKLHLLLDRTEIFRVRGLKKKLPKNQLREALRLRITLAGN